MKESGVMEPTRSTRWQEAKAFAEVNARDMALPNPNPVQGLFIWFQSVKLYHQAEMEQIARGAPTEQDRQERKHLLSVVINVGEWMVRELRQHDVTATAGVTLADVEATLEGLYESLRVSFGGMTEARRAQVLDEVFGAS